jgi:hypothetical protein
MALRLRHVGTNQSGTPNSKVIVANGTNPSTVCFFRNITFIGPQNVCNSESIQDSHT